MRIAPPLSSTTRKSATARDDLPAPVRPTTPTRVRGGTLNDSAPKTGAAADSYLRRTPRNSMAPCAGHPSGGEVAAASAAPSWPAAISGVYASVGSPVVYSSTRSTSFIEISSSVFRLKSAEMALTNCVAYESVRPASPPCSRRRCHKTVATTAAVTTLPIRFIITRSHWLVWPCR
eukprot:3714873-Prymnesium_polylepis.1